ncbi:hypothetical protein ACWGJ2_03475 [Streptomyces sp. NPDC054796]
MTAAEHAAHAESYQRAALAQASSVALVAHSRAGARAHEVPYGRREQERRAQEIADQDEAVRRQFEGLLGRGREREDSGSRPGARDDRFDIAQAMSFMPGGHREATPSARAPYPRLQHPPANPRDVARMLPNAPGAHESDRLRRQREALPSLTTGSGQRGRGAGAYAPPGLPRPGHGAGGQGRSGGHGQGSHERPAYGVGAPRYRDPAAPAKRHH